MKKIPMAITLIFSLFMIANVSAQTDVTKEELLSSINIFNELGLSNDKAKELSDYNNGFTDRVFDIMNSQKSENDKIIDLKRLRDTTSKDLNDILGEDLFKSYRKTVKKKLKPLKRKTRLLKFII